MKHAYIWKKLRNDKGLTLRELSVKTKISKDILYRMENGQKANIHPDHICILAEFYDEDYIYLMNCAGYKTPENNNKRLVHFEGLPTEIYKKAKDFVFYLKNEDFIRKHHEDWEKARD